ncbi:MAG: hypothetical protein PF637_03165 [Spirochaetes bacterium]|jgi:ABC-type sugar transport system substrate-binding protein|nr:hypothetical protein [Spirochaetota bacterium]
MQRLFESGRKNTVTISFDKTDESLDCIKKGYLTAAVAQRQGLWGELIIRRLYEALDSPKEISEFEDTGTYEINTRNVSTFQ